YRTCHRLTSCINTAHLWSKYTSSLASNLDPHCGVSVCRVSCLRRCQQQPEHEGIAHLRILPHGSGYECYPVDSEHRHCLGRVHIICCQGRCWRSISSERLGGTKHRPEHTGIGQHSHQLILP